MKTVVALLVGFVLFFGGSSVAFAANTYDSFVTDTESLLAGMDSERGGSAGWKVGRKLFQDSRVSDARWKDTGVLCKVLALNAKDGKFTAKEINSTARMVWGTEQTFVDMLTGAGGSVADTDDLMLVDFTIIASGVNHRCPKWNNLVFGRFSDALYKLYSEYAH